MKSGLLAAAGILGTAGVVWLIAQGSPTNSLASVFPGGALVYVEARDFSSVLRDWNSSAEKSLWLTSSNYDVFSRTRLFMRLAEAQKEFAESANFAPDMSLLDSIAGGQSAVAIYDIGELEFLYVTRLPAARVMASTPFSARTAYEARESAGIPYFIRSGNNKRVAAFGTVDGLLFLGTRGDLVANALALQARQPSAAPLAQDRWFDALTRTAASPGEVRISLNMTSLLKTPYFRPYWIQRNASELRPFSAGVIDLFRDSTQVREERVLIREQQSTPASEQPLAQVVAWAPADSGLYRAWAAPTTERILALVDTKLIRPGGESEGNDRSAPMSLNPDSTAGNASDLETRIDQQALEQDSTDALGPLRIALTNAPVQAMLHVQSSRPAADGVFVRNDSAIALLGSSDWQPVDVPGIATHRQGRILVLASDGAMLQRIVGQLGAMPSATSGAYAARYLHARELTPFVRMMTQIDTGSPQEYDNGPRFFSQNVASLGRALQRVESEAIVVHDDGLRVTQQVVYILKP